MQTVEPSDYRDLALASSPAVSPGGERVAFVRTIPRDDESYEATVYVAPVGGDEPERFTLSEGVDAEPTWSPSGDRLAFVSTRGEDDDRQQLWVLEADGGEARQVTSVVGGVNSITWSPDGERIAFLQQVTREDRDEDRDRHVDSEYEPEEPDPRVIDRTVYRAGAQYMDGRRTHAYAVDLTDDAVRRLTTGDVDHVGVDWVDTETLYYGRKVGEDPDDSLTIEILEQDLETGTETSLTTDTSWGTPLRATSDGRVAYFHTPVERSTLRQTEVRVFDPETGETHTPTAGLDRTMAYDADICWGADEERLYFPTPEAGSVVLRRVTWNEGESADDTTIVAGSGMHLTDFDVGRDVAAFVASEWDHPGDVFLSTPGGGEGTRLTRLNSGYLDDRAVCQPEELRFENPDGDEIQGWLLTPPDFDPDETYPLVVEVHGGPHVMWSPSDTMWHEFQSLAAAGYCVFFCNPRGSAGYGEAFMAAIECNWGAVTSADVLAGLDAVCARDSIDAENVFLTGGSFGGYMTAWLAGHSDRFRATVAQRGVYDLLGFYGSTDVAYKLVEGDFGTRPWDDPEFLWEHSPAAHAETIDAPTLVMHAENDFRVPIDGAELLFRFLRKAGTPTRFVRYPREGHELSRSGEPAHVVDRIERIQRWFDGYSDHCEVPAALERERDAGLSAGENDDE
ncbi:prolyl oligopeptidase family serine peptidase [Haloarchaeobius sp. TZWSO28]|uniref:S9 family peptidase n=1 Tax=Haloarchaeobius sp. TZWSO28 TaxID=3446119 RepID=UPI003EBF31FE